MVTIRLYPDHDTALRCRELLARQRIDAACTPDLLDRLFGIKFGHIGIQVHRQDIARALQVLDSAVGLREERCEEVAVAR